MTNTKSILIYLTKAPMANSANQEAVDLALAAASFEQEVSLLFEGDASFQLIPNQTPDSVGRKNLPKAFKAFPIYGIQDLYLLGNTQESLKAKIHAEHKNIIEVANNELNSLFEKFDTVIRF